MRLIFNVYRLPKVFVLVPKCLSPNYTNILLFNVIDYLRLVNYVNYPALCHLNVIFHSIALRLKEHLQRQILKIWRQTKVDQTNELFLRVCMHTKTRTSTHAPSGIGVVFSKWDLFWFIKKIIYRFLFEAKFLE